MQHTNLIAEGKTKSLYATDNPQQLIMLFRDDTTAFNGEKKAVLADKGAINNALNAHLMQLCMEAGIATHWLKQISATESLVRRCDMLPVECVIRNVACGSLCRRLGVTQGMELVPPVVEFFYKDDVLQDPMINRSHMQTFGWAEQSAIDTMEAMTRRVNQVLLAAFSAVDLQLVDFKLEFGWAEGQLVLGDEITPDSCRIWDRAHGGDPQSLDKDRFRQGLGDVVASYREVASRLGVLSLPVA